MADERFQIELKEKDYWKAELLDYHTPWDVYSGKHRVAGPLPRR